MNKNFETLPIIEKEKLKFYLEDFRRVLPLKNIQTVIVDPPYNINFNYGKNYKDNINPDEYKALMFDVLDLSLKGKKNFYVLINYPEIISELFKL